MGFNIYFFSLFASIIFFIIVISRIRKGILSERYSLFWLLFAVVMIAISLNVNLLKKLSEILKVYYAPSVLFFLGLLFIVGYSFHLTIILSKQSEDILKLAQEIAIFKNRLEKIEKSKEGRKPE
ncbi:MAG: DUF2304 domain-containing protein [Thermoanaerobacteraceae bacterium]|nr:DUF2304 domain-containing protein [Thermoanaerobacteraceae bacterium]